MLITFQKSSGGVIAINPKFIMMVEESKSGGANIIMSDGGTTKVDDSYLNVIGLVQGELNN